MNCQIFETLINDLTRQSVMDAATRAEALAHAEICTRCAARLRDEHVLTGGLRALMATSETIEAPLRVEQALRAAFCEHTTQSQALPFVTKPLAVEPARAEFASHWIRRAAAIAAALLIAIMTLALRSSYAPPTARDAAANKAGSDQSSSLLVKVDSALPVSANDPAETIDAELYPNKPRNKIVSETNYAEHFVVTQAAHRSRRGRSAASVPAIDEGTGADEGEIATDFLPLTDASNLSAEDGGQLVRVELPRSALLTFGLPMNIERADEPVKADVLVGQDGMARAIRFVR